MQIVVALEFLQRSQVSAFFILVSLVDFVVYHLRPNVFTVNVVHYVWILFFLQPPHTGISLHVLVRGHVLVHNFNFHYNGLFLYGAFMCGC